MDTSGNYATLKFQSGLGFSKTVINDQLSMGFWECGIAGTASKVVIFEKTFLVKVSFFVYLCSHIYSLFLKVPPKDKKLLYSCFSILQYIMLDFYMHIFTEAFRAQ